MKIKFLTLLGALSLLGSGCSDPTVTDSTVPDRRVKVIVGSSPRIDIATRTEIGEDGTTVHWQEEDKITLWAVNARNEGSVDATDFALYHYNADFSTARFTADIPSMAQGTYTYYALSPRPRQYDLARRKASYTLPSTQDGGRQPACDVMVAAPVTAEALKEGDNSSMVNFRFAHKIHLLKIRIAANRLGKPVDRLTLRFPVAVTGQMEVDMQDAAAAPTVTDSEEGRLLRLTLPRPVNTGDVVYAAIAPTALGEQDKIEIRAFSGEAQSQGAEMPGKDFAAGHTTPIALTIPREQPATRVEFSLDGDGTQTIGEPLTALTLVAPDGLTLPNGTLRQPLTPSGDNRYELRYHDSYTTDLSGKTLTLEFETENTLTRRKVTLPRLNEGKGNRIEVGVPSLYVEDFASVQAFDYHTAVVKGFTQDGRNYAPVELAQYGLEGWTGTRVGAAAGKGLRIACRVNVAVIAYNYDGRVDSSPITAIKEGRKVNLEVTFGYAADRQLSGSVKDGNPLLTVGSTREQGPIDITRATENIVVDKQQLPAEGDGKGTPLYDKMKNTMTRHITNADNQTRLTFHITDNASGSFNGYAVYWIYLDNVKVRIAK